MMQWIDKKINNEVYVITAKSEIDFIHQHDHALIGYHLSEANTHLLQNVLHHHSYNVQFATFKDQINDEQHNSEQTLVFYRNGQEWLSITQKDDTNTFTIESMNKLIEYGLLPIVEELTPHNYVKYIHAEVPIFWLWIDMDHKSMNEPIFSSLYDLMSYRRVSKLEPFGVVYSDSHKFKTHMTAALDIDDTNSFPQALFIYEERKYHYPHNHNNDFSFDVMMEFIQSIMDTSHHQKVNDKIQFGTRSLPSQYGNPLHSPIDSMQDAVYAINTEYHDHIVYNTNMAVVVQYYARWSLRCKHFASDYRRIGQYFHNQTDVLITKLNIVHNDAPFYLSDLPQIVLYHKGNGNQYVSYHGIMHSHPIIEWINQNKHFIEHSSMYAKLAFD